MQYTLIQAQQADKHFLADIRIEAMQPSLEILNRFDPIRVRARLLDNFDPKVTQTIVVDHQIVGFFCTKNQPDALWLTHLYFLNKCQGLGLGKAIINHIKTQAASLNKPLKLQALRKSPANGFYKSQAFVETHQEEWDIFYQWNQSN